MKPPISYYGGKQRLASKIVPLIPKHTVYCEPFAGGAAILFAKPWPNVTNNNHYREVINDIDGDLVNFYRQLRENGEQIIEALRLTPYSELEHQTAKLLGSGSDLERARRYCISIQQSFSNMIGGGWSRGKFGRNFSATWADKISQLPDYLDRMSSVAIANTDALKFIGQFDSPQTFFYCDPPYPGANQGHYSGYTIDDYKMLIKALSEIKGSHILSNYPQNVSVPDKWERFDFNAFSSAAKPVTNQGKTRIEVVYRKISTVPVRPELQKLYDSGAFDCFTGRREFTPGDTVRIKGTNFEMIVLARRENKLTVIPCDGGEPFEIDEDELNG